MALSEPGPEELGEQLPTAHLELVPELQNPYDSFAPEQLKDILIESMSALTGTTHCEGVRGSGIGARYVFRCLLECIEKGGYDIAPPRSISANRSLQEFTLALDALVRRKRPPT